MPPIEGGPGAGEVERVEAPGGALNQHARLEVPGVERLQGVRDHDGVPRASVCDAHGVIHHIEQLAHRHGRWAREVGALIAPGVRHHQMVAGRQQRIEEELPVLAPHLGIADPLVARSQVVPVALDVTRETPVVQAQQAHHPVRDGAHGHERAHGQMARAEIGPSGLALQTVGQDRPQVVTAKGDRARDISRPRLVDQALEQATELCPLPRVTHRRRGE